MKTVASTLALVILLIGACGCKSKKPGTSVSNFKPRYVPAAKGTPEGTAATQMIDANGGKVTSADGRITVTIPAGVFTTATEVSIQPITNTAPNGLGVGYRLLPEGTTFNQPATVTFHLDQVQAAGIDSAFVISQRADGLWYSQPHQSRDASAQTVSVSAKHFSDWTIAKTVLLKPQQTRVKTSQTASFTATVIITKDVDTGDDELANPLGDDEVAVPAEENLTNQIEHTTPSWQVNGKDGGTDRLGHIVDDNASGDYKAPKVVPNPSEVTVSLTLKSGNTKVIAPAKATIYDQETWSGSSHIKQPDGTVVDSTFVFAQTNDDGHGHLKFNVQKGTVHITSPDTLPNGCSLKVSPKDHDIGPNEGFMTATYDIGSGGESPMVAGMGTTVWQATYTTYCPNGPGSMVAGVQAQWWPMTLGAPTPLEASNGVYDNVVNTPMMGSGTVHLVRDK